MIITVTLNAAMDKTVWIDSLKRGGLNRIRRIENDGSGKGINVSRSLYAIGEKSLATGFLGGTNGMAILKDVQANGIEHDFVMTKSNTRTNTKVREDDGTLTEINEPGAFVTPEEIEELVSRLAQYANPETLFILSGSIPQGAEPDIYARLIRILHEKGASVLLDASGEPFRLGVAEKPEIIKPNRVEIEEYCGLSEDSSTEEIIEAARSLVASGIGTVAVTNGQKGAMLFTGDIGYACDALPVVVGSTVGAGDAFAAGLAYGWKYHLEPDKTMELCMAASAATVTTQGTKPASAELINELKKDVHLTRI